MLTYIALAVANGGATTPAAALANTWAQFSTGVGPTNAFGGPANVKTWDGRRMSYYTQGFSTCSLNAENLVQNRAPNQDGTPGYTLTTSGQCGAFAWLLESALAMNGVHSNWIQVQPVPYTAPNGDQIPVPMAIKNWTFGPPTFPSEPYWKYKFKLNSGLDWMYPPRSDFGDLSNIAGVPGQNEQFLPIGVPPDTPVEKVFAFHFIVKVSIAIGNQYYDPSYGLTYPSEMGLESQAVEGYIFRFEGDPTDDLRLYQPIPGFPRIVFTLNPGNSM